MDLGVRRPRSRSVARAAIGAAVAAAAVLLTAGPANAAVGPVHVAPSSGPPGTTFTVSGSGCGPGLFVSASDYASVSTSLALNVHAPVNSAGSWSTTFRVPNGTLAVPKLIAATCFTDGLPSLTTIYTPGTFVVTAAPTPTTAPPPPTTPTTSGSSNTPTTKGTTASTTASGTGSSSGGRSTSSGVSAGVGSLAGTGSGSATSQRAGSGSGGGRTVTADGVVTGSGSKRAGAVAGLRSPELAGDSHAPTSGVNPWWWALLALVIAGGVGTWLWLRRRGATPDETATTPAGSERATAGHEPDDGTPLDDEDDDWPSFPVLDPETTSH